jgi:hypothetical protein
MKTVDVTNIKYAHAYVGDPRPTGMRGLRKIKNAGRVTIAWTDNGFDKAEVGLAWCSPRDNFCRKKGRLIASGRLFKGANVATVVLLATGTNKSGEPRVEARDVIKALDELHMQNRLSAPTWACRVHNHIHLQETP